MTRDEEIMAAVISERGYLVMRTVDRYQPGALVKGLMSDLGRPMGTAQRFYVIGPTDVADFEAQKPIIERFGCLPHASELPGDTFYRIGTD